MEPILIIGTCKVQEGRLALHRPCQKRALVIKDLRHQRGEKSLKNPSSCGSWVSVEQLENRLTPSAYGQQWLNPEHLTLSFPSDGTAVGSVNSNLLEFLNL